MVIRRHNQLLATSWWGTPEWFVLQVFLKKKGIRKIQPTTSLQNPIEFNKLQASSMGPERCLLELPSDIMYRLHEVQLRCNKFFFRTKPHRNSRTLPVSLTSSTWALVPVTWRSGRCRLCKPRTSRRDARSPVIASLRLRSRTLSLVRFLRMANTEMGSRTHGPLLARLLWQSSLSGKACSPCWSALQL